MGPGGNPNLPGCVGQGRAGPPDPDPNPNPVPNPDSNPNSNPNPDHNPDPNPNPGPDSNLDPDLDPDPNPNPNSNPNPDSNPHPDLDPDSKPNPDPDPDLSLSFHKVDTVFIARLEATWSPRAGQPGAAAGSCSGAPCSPHSPRWALCCRLRLGLDGGEGPGLLRSPSPSWEVPGGCWSSPELLR